MPLLECRGLAVSYGAVQALKPTDLNVEAGQLVGLIGPNGAGKTTLIDAVTGFARSQGQVNLSGVRVDGKTAHLRAQAGLGRTFQGLELFDDLTVRENVLVPAEKSRWWSPFADAVRPSHSSDGAERARRALASVGVEEHGEALPTELPNGIRKLVAVARALAGDPKVILLDEPAAGLDTDESQALGQHLRRLVENGPGMLLVDHDMGLVLSICDHVYVLDFGELIAEGPPQAVRSDSAVIAAYLGSGATA